MATGGEAKCREEGEQENMVAGGESGGREQGQPSEKGGGETETRSGSYSYKTHELFNLSYVLIKLEIPNLDL